MKEIKVKTGEIVKVDDQDYHNLIQWNWSLNTKGYASRRKYIKNGVYKLVLMHRLINNTPDNYQTDHINRNKLDNRRCNLRTVNGSVNQVNRNKQTNNTSGFVGVSWNKLNNKWMSMIQFERKQKYLGLFSNIHEAVLARKRAERIYFPINSIGGEE